MSCAKNKQPERPVVGLICEKLEEAYKFPSDRSFVAAANGAASNDVSNGVLPGPVAVLPQDNGVSPST